MHQQRPRLSAKVRRKIFAALVVASSTGTLAADTPRDSAQAPPGGSTSEADAGSTLKLRLTRRSWLKSATGDSSAKSRQNQGAEPSADAPAVGADRSASRWEAAGAASPKPGQPVSPELPGSPQSPEQSPEPALAPHAAAAESGPASGNATSDGWVVRGSTKADAPPESDREAKLTEPSVESDRSAAPRTSHPSNADAPAEGRTDDPSTEKPEPRPARSLQSAAQSLQPAESAAEVQERLEKVVVRRLRVGRDGSLPDQSSGEPSERSSRGLLSTEAARSPAGDHRRRETSRAGRPLADSTRDGRSGGAAEPIESQTEPQSESPVELDYTGRPAEPIELAAEVRRMQPTMRRCLQHYFDRPEQAPQRSNWGMLHAIMVYGVDTPILAGRESYSAIAWIAGNNICRGKRLLREGPSGIEARTGIGLQGHQAQLLAVFAMVGVPADYPLYAGRSKYSVEDLVQAEARACRSGEELTFSLIGLAHYLDTDAVWTGADGERWDFQRLIREELAQPIVGTTCGGTHRLMGFAHALRQRRLEGRPIEGQWLRAEKYLDDFVDYTYRLQNRDGSMSTNWFEGREDNGDLDRKVQTTGHMVEFLLTITPDSQLQDPKLVAAIQFLLGAMNNRRDHDWSIGPKGHALRSLAMYYQRVYGEGTPWQARAASRSRPSRRR